MPYFKIYHGMSGGFGGAQYDTTEEFSSREEAQEEALERAIEDYQSYEGMHGILDWNDCRQALIDSGWPHEDDDVDDYYQNEIADWIDYYVVEAAGPEDGDNDDC